MAVVLLIALLLKKSVCFPPQEIGVLRHKWPGILPGQLVADLSSTVCKYSSSSCPTEVGGYANRPGVVLVFTEISGNETKLFPLYF
jgi:hypothetical protein